MRISDVIHERRKELGLTQLELAQLSKVSVPFIQLIENGKANPSLQVASALLESLGARFAIESEEPAWSELSKLGVPLTPHPEKLDWRGKESEVLLRRAYLYTRNNTGFPKERDAIESYLIAIQDHYPAKFKNFKDLASTLPKKANSRLIKLRRISLSNISKIF